MRIEDRLTALEARLREADDRLEILNLLNSYGPLMGSGEAEAAAQLWTPGGGYDFNDEAPGGGRLASPEQLVATYENRQRQRRVNTGVSHFTGTPRIAVYGDKASAIGYSFVVLKEGDRWIVVRGAIDEWMLARTPAGWRIAERLNRTLDGSQDSHDVMRRVVDQ